MKYEGRIWKFGAHVDTDAIIAARYLVTSDPQELAKYLMEDVSPGFVAKMKPGDLLVAGENFGCGSSREHAPIAIKAAGITCVVAASFARIFYRSSFNVGLPIVECPEAAQDAEEGDVISVDLDSGTITNKTKQKSYQAAPIPPFMQELVNDGGLINHLKKQLK